MCLSLRLWLLQLQTVLLLNILYFTYWRREQAEQISRALNVCVCVCVMITNIIYIHAHTYTCAYTHIQREISEISWSLYMDQRRKGFSTRKQTEFNFFALDSGRLPVELDHFIYLFIYLEKKYLAELQKIKLLFSKKKKKNTYKAFAILLMSCTYK